MGLLTMRVRKGLAAAQTRPKAQPEPMPQPKQRSPQQDGKRLAKADRLLKSRGV